MFYKKATVNSAKCEKTAHMVHSIHLHRHDVLTVPLTVLLHYPIYKHDAYTVLLVLKSGW